MEILPNKTMQYQSTIQQPPPAFIPDELISEILSFLSVKTIVRLKCLNKSWNTRISDQTFVQKHFKVSSQNPQLIFTPPYSKSHMAMSSILPISVRCLLERCLLDHSSITLPHSSMEERCQVVGSCMGVLCLVFDDKNYVYRKYQFCLLNPAMRTISNKLGTFHQHIKNPLKDTFKFSFGCDISTGIFKVVAYCGKQDKDYQGSWRSHVGIFSLSDNYWRIIESFPLIPITCIQTHHGSNEGVYLSGNVNWLALRKYFHSYYNYGYISCVEEFVIVSLDLSTEKYRQFLLPPSFDELPHYHPTLHVLMDCLCFSHDFKRTEFVIWQMKEFGVQDSWTQLFRIQYLNLQMYDFPDKHDKVMYFIVYSSKDDDTNVYLLEINFLLLPLYISENGDTLIFLNYQDNRARAIVYNHIDNKVERIKISNKRCLFSAMNYVESLVSTSSKSATSTPSTS